MGAQTNGGTAAKSCGCCAPVASEMEPLDADEGSASCDAVGGVQEGRVTVQGGYSPGTVRLARGVPARLVFDRQESSRCSEELLIPAFGIEQMLPTGRETVIEFTPQESGTFAFTCGMGMLRGEIVVS